ncbi:heme NO-binding domain-containing protein [Sphingomonas sp. DT-51]|uniref:heme NO-binding domain-containing protein n=1 Tax=Sphingomonas sp. DT-51 TaxID=3396165 RepID=UPI003F1CCA67
MKGLVFTTFFEFCERNFGADMLDDVIEAANLPHGGAYTSVGTYPFQEMVALITGLTRRSGTPMPTLMERFGTFCFEQWVNKFPQLFRDRDLFDVLDGIDDFHEREVRRLYPDAELPSFRVVERTYDQLTLDYRSCKPLADLAVGVIKGAAVHLREPVEVSYSPLGDTIRFTVTRNTLRRVA